MSKKYGILATYILFINTGLSLCLCNIILSISIPQTNGRRCSITWGEVKCVIFDCRAKTWGSSFSTEDFIFPNSSSSCPARSSLRSSLELRQATSATLSLSCCCSSSTFFSSLPSICDSSLQLMHTERKLIIWQKSSDINRFVHCVIYFNP